ncbi:MAG: hypothetical protein IJR21_07665, partial [Synergistaceae bacterium]|nr:hypothetical protein [Synergistaceae bacterium]
GEKAHVTDAVESYAEDLSADVTGRLNSITVDEDGWYLMKVKMSSELYAILQEISADNLIILPVTDDELAEYESESEADVSRKSAKISRSRLRKADDESSSSTNKAKILSMSGGKLDNISSNEFLIAGNFKAGQTVNMYLAKAKTASSSTEPEKPNAREIKDAIESADLIAAALENAVSSDAAASLSDILNAMGEEGLIAYGINDLDEADFGNEETGFRFVLLSLDKDISSGDIIYVNLLSGDTYEQAGKAIDSTNGYFVLNLVSMDKIPWLLIDTQNLKQLSLVSPSLRDAQLEIVSRDYVVLARVLAQNDAQDIFKASPLKFRASAVTDEMPAYATNAAVLLNPNAAKTDPNPTPNPNPDPDGEDEINNQDNVSSHGSSSGCNSFNYSFGVLSLLALALALSIIRKHN